MSTTALAVILLGIRLIIVSQQHLSSTVTLVWGVIVVVLVTPWRR